MPTCFTSLDEKDNSTPDSNLHDSDKFEDAQSSPSSPELKTVSTYDSPSTPDSTNSGFKTIPLDSTTENQVIETSTGNANPENIPSKTAEIVVDKPESLPEDTQVIKQEETQLSNIDVSDRENSSCLSEESSSSALSSEEEDFPSKSEKLKTDAKKFTDEIQSETELETQQNTLHNEIASKSESNIESGLSVTTFTSNNNQSSKIANPPPRKGPLVINCPRVKVHQKRFNSLIPIIKANQKTLYGTHRRMVECLENIFTQNPLYKALRKFLQPEYVDLPTSPEPSICKSDSELMLASSEENLNSEDSKSVKHKSSKFKLTLGSCLPKRRTHQNSSTTNQSQTSLTSTKNSENKNLILHHQHIKNELQNQEAELTLTRKKFRDQNAINRKKARQFCEKLNASNLEKKINDRSELLEKLISETKRELASQKEFLEQARAENQKLAEEQVEKLLQNKAVARGEGQGPRKSQEITPDSMKSEPSFASSSKTAAENLDSTTISSISSIYTDEETEHMV